MFSLEVFLMKGLMKTVRGFEEDKRLRSHSQIWTAMGEGKGRKTNGEETETGRIEESRGREHLAEPSGSKLGGQGCLETGPGQ